MSSASKTETLTMGSEPINDANTLGFHLQDDKISAPNDKKASTFGRVLLGLTGAATVGLVVITTPFVVPALRRVCLPYVPATERQIANVLCMSKRHGKTMVDLGSGDGRVVCTTVYPGVNRYQSKSIDNN